MSNTGLYTFFITAVPAHSFARCSPAKRPLCHSRLQVVKDATCQEPIPCALTLAIGLGYHGLVPVEGTSPMDSEAAAFHSKDHIGWITLNRPDAGNTVNLQMATELREICHRINEDLDIRTVIVAGAGAQVFCLGEDLDEFAGAAPDDLPCASAPSDLSPSDTVAATIGSIECPIIAAINGDASGLGLALALACDLRIASEWAGFSVPDLSRGYLMPNGITQWLPRIVGRAKAMEMILTSEPIDAHEALRIGLVHRLTPHDRVLVEAQRLATQTASGAPVALRYAKEAANKGMDLTLGQALRLECDLYMILQTTRDRLEGITAFREKRPPDFKGA